MPPFLIKFKKGIDKWKIMCYSIYRTKGLEMVKLFICIECGETFLEPTRWTEDRGEYFGFPTSEEFVGCPYCNAPYTEAHRCDCCEEWITGDYIKTDDGRRYCDNCITLMELGDE